MESHIESVKTFISVSQSLWCHGYWFLVDLNRNFFLSPAFTAYGLTTFVATTATDHGPTALATARVKQYCNKIENYVKSDRKKSDRVWGEVEEIFPPVLP